MSKKILITGGTGLIGKELTDLLIKQGHQVSILTRQKKKDSLIRYFEWDINKEFIEDGALNVDVIIHLAGAGVADKRWTEERKRTILESRIKSTALLKKEIGKLDGERPAYIGASAIGIYGNQDDQPYSENQISQHRDNFLVDVVHQWEAAHLTLKEEVSNFAIVRIGIVLSKNGGALEPMLIPFNFRMGNYFGDGSQIFSWIHITDLCRIFSFIVENKIDGVYNAVAPHPVSGKDLIKSIAQVKLGPFIQFGVPEWTLRIIFGEMAQAILMSSWISASKILEKQFHYEYETIDQAIMDLLQS